MNTPHDDPRRMRPDHAPTPFSAAEIRKGCPTGRTVRFLVEPPDAQPYFEVTRFVATDEQGADHESQRRSIDGEPLEPAVSRRSGWEEFQLHASFPSTLTTIVEEEVEVQAGRFACLRYTVETDDRVESFWFARELPGMPGKVVSAEGGGGATVVSLVASR
jgi:hypothetical protein